MGFMHLVFGDTILINPIRELLSCREGEMQDYPVSSLVIVARWKWEWGRSISRSHSLPAILNDFCQKIIAIE